jgi:non-homologous end joining protein Ku
MSGHHSKSSVGHPRPDLPPERQPEAAPPTNVVNLMDALRRSIEAEKPAEQKKPEEAERRTGKGARKAG